MRFACPSASSSSLLTGSSKATTRPIRRSARLLKIKESKAVQAGKKVEKRRIRIQYCRKPAYRTVYIGNLIPGITDHTLVRLFQGFGSIQKTTVRCSQGVYAPRTKMPSSSFTSFDHDYATVQYNSPSSARKALVLNGKNLCGINLGHESPLIVSLSPADLPEAKMNLAKRLQTNGACPPPLVRSDTLPCDEYIVDKHRVYDVSFSKGIM